MKLRAPAVPLITHDPFFSIWSSDTRINAVSTMNWTGRTNSLIGVALIDGVEYSFLGYGENYYKMNEVSLEITALSTIAIFEQAGIRLTLVFTSPVLIDNLDLLSRPITYLSLRYESIDDNPHTVTVHITAKEDVCLSVTRQGPVTTEKLSIGDIKGIKMGNAEQKPLHSSGDDVCIDWGYFYLCAVGESIESSIFSDSYNDCRIKVTSPLIEGIVQLYLFAYDDIEGIEYFGKRLPPYWKKEYDNLLDLLLVAKNEYALIKKRCDDFSEKLFKDALLAGGEKYAELLSLSYRQIAAAHKLIYDENGEILYVSKECFSNGCAATVDITYPSSPMFLIYNPELLKGMLRPIYRYAESDEWKKEQRYDFAPHDAGQYPLLNGQFYGREKNLSIDMQMPVEECGNMIITETNIALSIGNADFARSHIDTLKKWCGYLIKYGDDPDNQLCTDDFAGHTAHNCNLSLKAIMGIAGMSIILHLIGEEKESLDYMRIARKMAKSWKERAVKADGSYKLAFDNEKSFSMKYNMIWDKLWETKLFSKQLMNKELKSNLLNFNKYGMPLDNRADYTKSDWTVWVATMAGSKGTFERFIAPLWQAYNDSPSRVPMGDWYDTKTAYAIYFRHRSVQGGLFMKLLESKNILKNERWSRL